MTSPLAGTGVRIYADLGISRGATVVHRIAGLDISGRLAGIVPSWLLKTLCALVGIGFAVLLRAVANLAERELLFRELQHRVGNDFAIVVSLLDLQRRRSGNAETRAALERAMGRIRSISRIHRHIYALPESRHVDLRQYLRDLCTGL